jgi:crotonobetaine/carnitine-CoA ligase
MQNSNGWIRAIDQGASPMFASQAGDIIYCALPLFNTGAWITSIYRALLEGIPCVIEPKFSVHNFWQRVAQFQATQTFLIGAMGVFLWNAPAQPADAETSLRTAMIVPFPPDLWTAFEQRFGLNILTAGLGMSECQLVANQLAAEVAIPPYALGYPPEDIELRLCDDEGNEVAVGEPGEMCVKPLVPHVLFNGYFDNEEGTRAAFRGDWFLTGDMARQDPANGALFFVDRKKDAVRFAGRNISTLEVEGVFRRHEAVSDVAAFGIPSAEIDSEDELKVNVVLKEGATATAEDLCRFVNENAPHYFVPRYLEFVQSLPYTPTNKVQKFKLREQGVSPSCWDLKSSGFQVQR